MEGWGGGAGGGWCGSAQYISLFFSNSERFCCSFVQQYYFCNLIFLASDLLSYQLFKLNQIETCYQNTVFKFLNLYKFFKYEEKKN